MAGLDEESGLLKPTVQKTRGITALVVAAAALSFFAGATAATAAVAGPTELWAEALGWGKIKLPKVPDWIKDDANKGKKDADEAYEDAVEVIEDGYEGAVDIINDVPGVVKEGAKDAIEAINDVDWAAAPEAVVEGSEEAIRGIDGALPSLADLKAFLNELNVFSKIDLDALLRDVGTFTPCLKQIQAIVRDARETADDVLDGDVRAVLNELDLLTLVSDLTGSLPDLKSLQDLLHSGFPGLDEIPSFLSKVTDITSTLPVQPGIINAVQAAIKLVKKCGECPDTLQELITCAKLGAQVGGVVAGVAN